MCSSYSVTTFQQKATEALREASGLFLKTHRITSSLCRKASQMQVQKSVGHSVPTPPPPPAHPSSRQAQAVAEQTWHGASRLLLFPLHHNRFQMVLDKNRL